MYAPQSEHFVYIHMHVYMYIHVPLGFIPPQVMVGTHLVTFFGLLLHFQTAPVAAHSRSVLPFSFSR